MNHYKSFGFNIQSPEDISKLYHSHQKYVTEGIQSCGSPYSIFRPDDHIELWFDCGPNDEIIDDYCEIGYRSDSSADVTVIEWASENKDITRILQVDTNLCPLNVTVPSNILTEIKEDAEIKMNITLLPYELSICDADDNDSSMAAESIIPCGTFSLEDDDDFEPQATAIVSGTITNVMKRCNPITDKSYFDITISCFGDTYTVVTAEEDISDCRPEPGKVLSGIFWLTGRVRGR